MRVIPILILIPFCMLGCTFEDTAELEKLQQLKELEALKPADEPIPVRPELPLLIEEEESARQALLEALKSDDETIAHDALKQLTKDGESFQRNCDEIFAILIECGFLNNRYNLGGKIIPLIEHQIIHLSDSDYKNYVSYQLFEIMDNSNLTHEQSVVFIGILNKSLYKHPDGLTILPVYGRVRMILALEKISRSPDGDFSDGWGRGLGVLGSIDREYADYINKLLEMGNMPDWEIFGYNRYPIDAISASEYEVLKQLGPVEWIKMFRDRSGNRYYLTGLLRNSQEAVTQNFELCIDLLRNARGSDPRGGWLSFAELQWVTFPAPIDAPDADKKRIDMTFDVLEELSHTDNPVVGISQELYWCVVIDRNEDQYGEWELGYGFERAINLMNELLFNGTTLRANDAAHYLGNISEANEETATFVLAALEKRLNILKNNRNFEDRREDELRQSLSDGIKKAKEAKRKFKQ